MSDLMVSLRSFLFPFLISEVILWGDEQDRYRMLLQAIAVAPAGQLTMVEQLARHLDQSKMGMLGQVHWQAAASKMISLTCKVNERPPTQLTLNSIPKGSRDDEAQG
jgi:hypothetical protein